MRQDAKQVFLPKQPCDQNSSAATKDSAVQQTMQPCNFQSPEPLSDKDSKISQTIQTFDPPQTKEEEGKEILEQEKEADDQLSASPRSNNERITVNKLIVNDDKKVPPVVAQEKQKIPQELLERLKEFEVDVSERVLAAISKIDISQAYGAIAHVENTFETIKDPTAIFLYQLPKQPIEKLGQIYPDEFLLKQKKEWEAIEKERAGGFTPMKDIPMFQALKAKLAKKTSLPKSLQ